jgi:glutamate-1-semialdehyde 2,1-aminomutase
MTKTITRSAALYDRALKLMPGGVSRNTVLRRPHPLYAREGAGCWVTDLEGVRRLDCSNNMASLIHGHAHPAIVAAVGEQLQRGTAFTMATEQAIDLAEHLLGRSASFEMIRFVNSGTEAVMGCLKAARAFTGRSRIAKVEGAYHGQYDFAEVSQTARPENWGHAERPVSVPVSRGTPQSVLDDVVIIPFDDAERALQILDRHADDLACVLIDPMPHRVGLAPADPAFIRALRDWTTAHGALLVIDEVITYRSEYGGAQTWYDVAFDLTAIGKMIGGGFPVGALAGRRDVMSVMDPLAEKVLFPHSGTFSANPVTMVAGLTAMRLFDRDAVARLNALGDLARDGIAEAIRIADVPACVSGAGSLLRVHMKPDAPRDYRACFVDAEAAARIKIVLDHCFDHGIMLINTCSAALSTAMTEQEIDLLVETLLGGLRKLRSQPELA